MKSRLFTAFVIAGLAGPAFGADTARVTESDGTTAKMVADMVSSRHISHPVIDDTIAENLLNRYVDIWDPQKLYFLQSDIDDFRSSSKMLDDQIRAGDVSFASLVFDRYQLRMFERADMIGKLIDADHDFSVDEDMVVDPDDLEWTKKQKRNFRNAGASGSSLIC